MPAIRDYTTRIGSATTVSTFDIPTPNSEAGDLLLAIITTYTNSVSRIWTSTGWTTIINATNTAQLQILYKIASAVENDITFTNAQGAETANAIVISIRDVNTTTPFGTSPVSGVISQPASARYMMPAITTNTNNSLLIYATANSSVGVPSIIEGPVSLIIGQDGGAESMGVGWGFKPTTGVTSSTVRASTIATGAGVNITLQIVPPASGASVIPGYCADDSSVYIDPINGTTAFNANSGLTRNSELTFGTLLNNSPSTGGYPAALADYGINSFHSVGQITNVANANTWYGGRIGFSTANIFNSTNKNLLVHVMPATPKQLQTTYVVTKATSGVGIGFGLSSKSLVDYKVWHVHGANTAWGANRVPCIINTSATAGVIRTAGTLNSASISAVGAFVSGTNELAVVWTFASLWLLDTVTIAGGNAAEPLDIAQIVAVGSDGHERMSLIKQGSNQMLGLGPVQFGNGGTNPVYLNLDSTAIEFPRQYNKDKREVYYNSIDNVAGLTYYAGPTDTIKHISSVISSPSKYHWKIHTSSSSAASYDFSGLSVIGAGTVQLKSDINLTDVTFNSCDNIVYPGNTLDCCVFTTSTATNNQGALILSSGSTSTLQTYINKLVGCSFKNNISPSGALMLEYTGVAGAVSLAMSNNFFSGNKKDIYWNAPVGSNLTLNLTNGANPSTYSASGANTVTFVNSNTFTISNVAVSSEVRVFRSSDSVELCGVETIGSSTPSNCTVDVDPDNIGRYILTYTHSNTNLPIFVMVVHLNYQIYRQTYTLTNSTQGLLVSQISDRQYSNPA